jgi:tetratricopeptide (TPR) repeat protein
LLILKNLNPKTEHFMKTHLKIKFLLVFAFSFIVSVLFAQDTTSFKTYYDNGVAKYKAKDYAGAIADFDKAITKKSDVATNMAVAYFQRATCKRIGLKDYTGALTDYDEAIKNKNDNADYYNGRALTKFELKDTTGAIADYTTVIQLKPTAETAYFERARLKMQGKDYTGAIEDFKLATEKKTDYYEAYNLMGKAKYMSKDTLGALAAYNKAIELNPDFISAYNNRASLKFFQKDYEGAKADFTKLIELKPEGSAYYYRGRANIRLKIAAEKIADAEKAKTFGSEACVDFNKAKELGFAKADEMLTKYCKDQTPPK